MARERPARRPGCADCPSPASRPPSPWRRRSPVPIAMPTSACARAGASLTPSPRRRPACHPPAPADARTCSRPSRRATPPPAHDPRECRPARRCSAAVRALSPVSIQTATPCSLEPRDGLPPSRRLIVSATASAPLASVHPPPTSTVVLPAPSQRRRIWASSAASVSDQRRDLTPRSAGDAEQDVAVPRHRAESPPPGVAWKLVRRDELDAACLRARDDGPRQWDAPRRSRRSRPVAVAPARSMSPSGERTIASVRPAAVIVPVLSSTTARTAPKRSRLSPPGSEHARSAPWPVPP